METSLLAFLAAPLLNERIKKTTFTREEYLQPWDYVAGCQICFDIGVALGLCYRSCCSEFAKLFVAEGKNESFIELLRTNVESLLAGLSPAPKTLFDLCAQIELEKTLKFSVESGFGVTRIPAQSAFAKWQGLMALGIGLGIHEPETAESLWVAGSAQKMWQSEEGARLIKAGLDVPATPPESPSIEEMQGQFVPLVSEFISRFRPDVHLQCSANTRGGE
jgi:hypothetical protein